jgi:hypothetical protein
MLEVKGEAGKVVSAKGDGKPGESAGSSSEAVARCVLLLVATVASAVGWVVGMVMGQDCEVQWLYNPVQYWKLLGLLHRSPWAWTSPDLRAALFDARCEIGAAAAMTAASVAAYYVGGPLAVQSALVFVGPHSGTNAGAKIAKLAGNISVQRSDEPELVASNGPRPLRRVTPSLGNRTEDKVLSREIVLAR